MPEPILEKETLNNDVDPSTTSQIATPVATPAKQSLEDVFKAHLDKVASQATKAEEEAEKQIEPEVPPIDPEKEKEEGEKEPEKKEGDDKAPVSYERFVEVNEAKGKAEKELEDTKPWAEAHRNLTSFLSEHSVSKEDFNYWMEVAALASSNPAKAMEKLQVKLPDLQAHVGEKLPVDLQKAVDEEGLPPQYAKELAASRAGKVFNARQQEQSANRQQIEKLQREAKEYAIGIQQSLLDWIGTKKADADFIPKKNGDPDGKFELVLAKFTSMIEPKKLLTKEEITRLGEQAYKDVSATFDKYAPKQTPTKVLVRTSRAANGGEPKPKTFEEHMANGMKKRGIAWTPPVRK